MRGLRRQQVMPGDRLHGLSERDGRRVLRRRWSRNSAATLASSGPKHKAAAMRSSTGASRRLPARLGAPGQASGDPRIIWRPPAEGVSSPPKVMTEEEAHRLAEAEGISLILTPRNASGYKGVSRNNKTTCSSKSGYCAQFCQYGRILRLGSFSGAPEAALAYARHVKTVTAVSQ